MMEQRERLRRNLRMKVKVRSRTCDGQEGRRETEEGKWIADSNLPALELDDHDGGSYCRNDDDEWPEELADAYPDV